MFHGGTAPPVPRSFTLDLSLFLFLVIIISFNNEFLFSFSFVYYFLKKLTTINPLYILKKKLIPSNHSLNIKRNEKKKKCSLDEAK